MPVLEARHLRKVFDGFVAVDDVSFAVEPGEVFGLLGPNGAGKSTTMMMLAGLLPPDAGTVLIDGQAFHPRDRALRRTLGVVPQDLAIYPELSARENLEFLGRLYGVRGADLRDRIAEVLERIGLAGRADDRVGDLSGGMKRRLNFGAALLHRPRVLILDEPTVGVDPLSRRELWEIILRLVSDEGLTVLLSTSYLDEAERCQRVAVMHGGKVLAAGPPASVRRLADGRTFLATPPGGEPARILQARLLDDPSVVDAVPEAGRVRLVRADGATGDLDGIETQATSPRFEDGFMVLLNKAGDRKGRAAAPARPAATRDGPAVEVRDLVRRFGAFTAVDHLSFEVRSGEIFGLLGPNGAGKTTTFRMLCGLLPATGGTLRVAGADLRQARASARQRIGYVAQKFSLYGQLSVSENLEFFAGAYGLAGRLRAERIAWAIEEFELTGFARLASGQLPGGYKQRLAMAAALMHQPEILFLDEPTSGADPLARREFWRRITALAQGGVTVIVTTHFMEEAEYCDRVVILDAGRLHAEGTPAEIRALAPARDDREPTMEDAFVAIVEEARRRGDDDRARAA
ncbi:MAG: ATP-binding cassette domain-containing protein [Bauldia sp.]